MQAVRSIEALLGANRDLFKQLLRESLQEGLEAALERFAARVLDEPHPYLILDHLPRKADDDCLQELRRIYGRRDLKEAMKLAA